MGLALVIKGLSNNWRYIESTGFLIIAGALFLAVSAPDVLAVSEKAGNIESTFVILSFILSVSAITYVLSVSATTRLLNVSVTTGLFTFFTVTRGGVYAGVSAVAIALPVSV